MIMNQKGKGQDCFETPNHIYQQLNRVFNFTHDVACTRDNSKCIECFPIESQNGLEASWENKRCFCNPPFSNKADWIFKAHYEVQSNNCPICVMILPALCVDSKAFHKYIEGNYHYEILEGRISFINPETGKAQSGNNCGTVIVYFKKKIKTKKEGS